MADLSQLLFKKRGAKKGENQLIVLNLKKFDWKYNYNVFLNILLFILSDVPLELPPLDKKCPCSVGWGGGTQKSFMVL